jgi:sn-glycerol 3-phosphate transport system substrate-binding protein
MKRRTMLAGSAAAAFAATQPGRARAQSSGRTQIVWWHAMTGANGDEINRIARDFNAAQSTVELQAIFKGSYPDTLNAAIAAWRAGQAPNIVQVFEVGTATMLAAGPAVKQVWELAKETGAAIRPDAYIPAVRGYYSLPDGRMASMPFNSSTAIMWYNKDAFAMAGLDPETPPATWPELVTAARALQDKWAKPTMAKDTSGPPLTAVTTSWFTWIQIEQFCSIHDLPFATEQDGFGGLGAELKMNGPAQVKQLQRLLDMAKDGTFKYAGRDTAPDPLFYTGQAAIGFGSSAGRADIVRNAKFKWAPALLPYDPEVTKQPHNTIIGGASLWPMTAPKRTAEEYKAVGTFLSWIGQPEQDAMYHQHTGYVPVTVAGYDLSKQQGYYEKNPGADLPIASLRRGTLTENSKGIRLGRLPEIRNIIYEEVEKALQGQQTAQQALDTAAERGNRVLREFQKSVRT